MDDSLTVKEYLRVHGVDNALDLSFDELKAEYERVIREGISYYHQLLAGEDEELGLLDTKKPDVISVLKQIQTIDELYDTLYDFLYIYLPTDLIAFMAEIKMPVPYTRLQRIIAIVYARVQDEVLDKIKIDLELLPPQERETLLSHYEGMRDDIVALEKLHHKYKSSGTLEYLRSTAETKLAIVQTFLSKDLEDEYKPYFNNSKEKRTLVSRILEISTIYTKNELFDMKMADLQATHDEITKQVAQREREQKLIRKYIEIFEDSAGMTESDFKKHCKEMKRNLDEDLLGEIISHFLARNHFIANKINNVLAGRSVNKQVSPSALMESENYNT